jgi:hypothetical protein
MHVLDWAEQPRFIPELLALAQPVACRVTAHSKWAPLGYKNPDEAKLDTFGPQAIPNHAAWPALRAWWLKYERGANTPNWDIALSCEIEGGPGLILVEAKANERELSDAGKRVGAQSSAASQANHERIGETIAGACTQLAPLYPGISIGRDRHYQLSNRIAFAWRLASLGIPTVLIYLGFLDDSGISNIGAPFRDESHWLQVFGEHLSSVCPAPMCECVTDCGAANFWLLARSRRVLESSSPVI